MKITKRTEKKKGQNEILRIEWTVLRQRCTVIVAIACLAVLDSDQKDNMYVLLSTLHIAANHVDEIIQKCCRLFSSRKWQRIIAKCTPAKRTQTNEIRFAAQTHTEYTHPLRIYGVRFWFQLHRFYNMCFSFILGFYSSVQMLDCNAIRCGPTKIKWKKTNGSHCESMSTSNLVSTTNYDIYQLW